MSKTAPQFDPSQQIGACIGELDVTLAEASATIDRLFRLKNRLAIEIADMRAERENLEIYDEAEAAALLRINPQHLAKLRRRYDLPHIDFGNTIRYSKSQLTAICEHLSINQKSTPARMKAAA